MASKHIPWPSIENLGVAYAASVLYRVELVDLAVLAIQRWWRWTKANRTSKEKTPLNLALTMRKKDVTPKQILSRMLYSRRVYERYPCVANEKFDGTNLGKAASDGTLYGRRTILSTDATSYQKAPLEKLSLVDVGLIKTELLKQVGLADSEVNSIEDVVLYGEFMLGHDKFGYRTRGVEAGGFYCFGIRLVLKGDTAALDADAKSGDPEEGEATEATVNEKLIKAIRGKLAGKGIWMTDGLTISMTPSLRDLIERSHPKGSINIVPLVAEANSITELVLDCPPVQTLLLAAKKCEGVVVAGHNGSFNFKWKTGDEDESKSALLLQRACELLTTYQNTVAFAPRETQVAEALLAVASNVTKSVKPPAPRKVTTVDSSMIELSKEIQKALESALTKYDSLDTYFAKDDAKTITTALCKEVLDDIKEYIKALEQSGSEKMTSDKMCEVTKNVEVTVRKKIGQAYGAWKKGKSK